MARASTYPAEFRTRGVQLYRDSERRTIAEVARELGVGAETFRKWVRQDEADRGEAPDKPTWAQLAEFGAAETGERGAVSYRPPAKRRASTTSPPALSSSRHRRPKSPGWLATACPIRRSVFACSSAREPFSTTYARFSPTSASSRAASSIVSCPTDPADVNRTVQRPRSPARCRRR